MYWLGGAGESSGTAIGTLRSGGGISGMAGRIEKKSRGDLSGGLGGRIVENPKVLLLMLAPSEIGLGAIL